MRPDLNELGLRHGTDKSTLRHNYMPLYQRLLPVKASAVLELGVKQGASLRVWRDYYPQARIVGLDVNPVEVEGCTIIVGGQDDPDTITQVAEYGPFDVIIDDASHLSSKTIASFQLLYPHLSPGGVYVVEDLHSSYWPKVYGQSEADLNPDTKKLTAMQFCKRLADEANFDPHTDVPETARKHALFPRRYWRGYHLSTVTFGYGICFIEKGPSHEP